MGDARRAPRTSAEFARRSAVGIRLRRGDHLRGGFSHSVASAHPERALRFGGGLWLRLPLGGFTRPAGPPPRRRARTGSLIGDPSTLDRRPGFLVPFAGLVHFTQPRIVPWPGRGTRRPSHYRRRSSNALLGGLDGGVPVAVEILRHGQPFPTKHASSRAALPEMPRRTAGPFQRTHRVAVPSVGTVHEPCEDVHVGLARSAAGTRPCPGNPRPVCFRSSRARRSGPSASPYLPVPRPSRADRAIRQARTYNRGTGEVLDQLLDRRQSRSDDLLDLARYHRLLGPGKVC